MSFRAPDGAKVAGAIVGKGRLGVVLAHQTDGSVCQLWPFARELSRRGVRALAFDFEGFGASERGSDALVSLAPDVRAAAAALRSAGARRIVLIGASMGGTAVLTAAASGLPGLAGVVSLSAPTMIFSTDAAAVVGRIRVPILLAASEADRNFPADARELHRRAAGRSRLVLVPTGGHGVDLLTEPKVREGIFQLLDDAAR